MKFSSSLTFVALALSRLSLAAPTPYPQAVSGDLSIPTGNASSTLDETPGSGGQWTAIFDHEDPRSLDELITEMGLDKSELKYVFDNSAFKGFAGSLSTHCVNKMSTSAAVKYFEPEIEIKIAGQATNAPWGLQRLSQTAPIAQDVVAAKGIDGFTYTYEFDGDSETDLGKGVDIYILDTGINVNHIDFDGRAKFGFAFDNQMVDNEGHGTHCAGTAASTTFGVAKGANIIAVKVLGTASGSSSDILRGIDWMIQNHDTRKAAGGFVGSVASMSLGSAVRSVTLDEAVQQASVAGIHFSVAAGNENQVACNSSPAFASRGSDVISVGATNIRDERAQFSNFGECVSVYGPGQDITSTWIGDTNSVINTISGTSMACPHVTGLIAYFLAKDPSLTPAQMKAKIIKQAIPITTDKTTARDKDPSILMNNKL